MLVANDFGDKIDTKLQFVFHRFDIGSEGHIGALCPLVCLNDYPLSQGKDHAAIVVAKQLLPSGCRGDHNCNTDQ